jgi:hypothetical protein
MINVKKMYLLFKLILLTIILALNSCEGQGLPRSEATMIPNDSIYVRVWFAPLDSAKRWGFGEKRPSPAAFKEIHTEKFYRYGSEFNPGRAKWFLVEYHKAMFDGQCGYYRYMSKWGDHSQGISMNFQNCNPLP